MRKELLAAFMLFFALASLQVSAYPEAGIAVIQEVDSVCPCSTLSSEDVSLMVTNLDDKEATYNLALNLPDDKKWSGFIVPEVTLSGGESMTVPIFVTPSCSVSPGDYSIGVLASSDVSGKITEDEFQIEVSKCRWVGIEADDYEVCQGKESSFEVMLVNDGKENERVKLTTNAEWAVFPVDVFDVESGEETTAELVLSPPSDLEGTGDLTIMLESEISYFADEETVEVDVLKCYGTELSVVPDVDDVCPCKTAEFMLQVNNTGLYTDNYTIDYGGLIEKIGIAEGESAEVLLSIDVPCDREAGDYPLDIAIDSEDPNAPVESSVIVEVYPLDECYAVAVISDGMPETLNVGESVAYIVAIGNAGKFAQTYDIVLDAPEWVYLSDEELTLEPGYGEEIYVYVAPPYGADSGNYSVGLSVNSDNEQGRIGFEVTVVSDFDEGADEGSITMNISIPTGEVTEAGDRPWSQIIMITILAIGVVFVLILRFVIMMK